MNAFSFFYALHVGIGALALGAFWMAGLSRKGSRVHVLAGKIYLVALTVVLASAFPLAIRILLRGAGDFAWFLLYLLVITSTAVWTGWRAIRDKRDYARFIGPVYRVLAVLNVASGAAVLALGMYTGRPILIAFSFIGLLGGGAMLRNVRRGQPDSPRWWMREHLGAMIGTGIATHIAFLGIGLPKLLPMLAGPVLQNIAWFGPLAVAIAARILLGRKYLRMPAARTPATADAQVAMPQQAQGSAT